MKKLMTVKDMADRYQCSEKTARRYMRQMDHMEKPLRVTEQAVEIWEMERTRMPVNSAPKAKRTTVRRSPQVVPFYIPRVRPKGARV